MVRVEARRLVAVAAAPSEHEGGAVRGRDERRPFLEIFS